MQERKVIGKAPDEFVSEYSVPNIVNQLTVPEIITQYQGLSGFLSPVSHGNCLSRLDDHAQPYELSVMAKTKKMVQVLLDFIANWREFYDHSYFRDLTSNQRRLEK